MNRKRIIWRSYPFLFAVMVACVLLFMPSAAYGSNSAEPSMDHSWGRLDPGDPPGLGDRLPGVPGTDSLPPLPWIIRSEGLCAGLDDDGDQWCDAGKARALWWICCRNSGAGDPNDADPAVFPGAPESCDGVDNDGNGRIDEGCHPGTPYPRTPEYGIRNVNEGGWMPTLAWNGRGFGAAWVGYDKGESAILFGRTNAAGEILDDPPLVVATGPDVERRPSLVWTGSEYGLAWQSRRPGLGTWILFTRISAEGELLEAPRQISATFYTAGHANLRWTGTRYALVYRRDHLSGTGSEVRFATRDDSDGEWTDLPVTEYGNGTEVANPKAAWTGEGVAVIWPRRAPGGPTELHYALVDRYGNEIVPDTFIDDGLISLETFRRSPVGLTWSGSALVAVYSHVTGADPEVRGTRFDLDGHINGGPTTLGAMAWTSDDQIGVAWDGSGYGVVWTGPDRDIRFAGLVDDTGLSRLELPDPEYDGADDDVYSISADEGLRPELVWTGYEFAAIHDDYTPSHSAVRMTRIRSFEDLDGDGFNLYTDTPDIYGLQPGDTNEADAGTNPNAVEICDGLHNSSLRAYYDTDCWQPGHAHQFGPFGGLLCSGEHDCEPGDAAWSGEEVGLVVREDSDDNGVPDVVHFGAFLRDGTQIGTTITLGSSRFTGRGSPRVPARLAWAGPRLGFGILWADNNSSDDDEDLYFARLEKNPASGEYFVADERRVSVAPGWVRDTNLVWDGETFAAVWVEDTAATDSYDVYFARISEHGQMLGRPSRVSEGDSPVFPDLAWSRWPTAVPTGDAGLHVKEVDYGIAWQHRQPGATDTTSDNREIFFANVNATGDRSFGPTNLTNNPFVDLHPSVTRQADGGYAVVFTSDQRGASELFMVANAQEPFGRHYVPWVDPPEPVISHSDGDTWIYDHPRLVGPLGSTKGARVVGTQGLAYDAYKVTCAGVTPRAAYDAVINEEEGAGTVSPRRVSNPGEDSMRPRADWTGQDFGLTWYVQPPVPGDPGLPWFSCDCP